MKRRVRAGTRCLFAKKGFQTCVPSRSELEMTDLEALVVAAYVFADEYRVAACGRPAKVTDAELVALAVAQAAVFMPLATAVVYVGHRELLDAAGLIDLTEFKLAIAQAAQNAHGGGAPGGDRYHTGGAGHASAAPPHQVQVPVVGGGGELQGRPAERGAGDAAAGARQGGVLHGS